MSGINVLNKIDVKSTPTWAIVLLFVAVLLGLLFMIISVIFDSGVIAIISCICYISFVVFGICVCAELFDKYDYTKYEVTIDDSVNMKEFYDKYDIEAQRGEIFVIREKE